MAPEETRPDHLPRAIAFMVASGLCFALMGAMVKLSGDVPLSSKVFFRNLVTLAITGAMAFRLRENPFARTPNALRLILRGLCGLGGVCFYFLALGELNLADASLLNKTAPFFVTGLAVLFLREKLHPRVVPALVAAFVGAVLVIKPGFHVQALPALAGLASGLCAGAAYTLVRSMKGLESPNRIILTFSLISTAATLPFLLANPPRPDPGQWFALIGTGVFAAIGQYGLTFAYHHAPASRISIFTYLHVLFALIVGFAIWGERPDPASIAGGLLIVGAAWWSKRGVS